MKKDALVSLLEEVAPAAEEVTELLQDCLPADGKDYSESVAALIALLWLDPRLGNDTTENQ